MPSLARERTMKCRDFQSSGAEVGFRLAGSFHFETMGGEGESAWPCGCSNLFTIASAKKQNWWTAPCLNGE
jgi:hypothetical protein